MHRRFPISLFVLREIIRIENKDRKTWRNLKLRGVEISPIFPACFSFREKVYT